MKTEIGKRMAYKHINDINHVSQLHITNFFKQTGLANSADPGQTAPLDEQSDLGLHYLPRLIFSENFVILW